MSTLNNFCHSHQDPLPKGGSQLGESPLTVSSITTQTLFNFQVLSDLKQEYILEGEYCGDLLKTPKCRI